MKQLLRMKFSINCLLAALGVALAAAMMVKSIHAAGAGENASSRQSAWVYFDGNGHLAYKPLPTGDRIMDFSHAGYMGGGVALPLASVQRTVQPSGGQDDTGVIQAAIDAVSAMPLKDGFRGAVLLGPGTFTCLETITISASGVVLRGSGSGSKEGPVSTIKLVGRPHLGIAVRSPGGGRGRARGWRAACG